jgi:hypothetical protein
VKRKKAQIEKASAGTVVGAKYRARCNELPDSERERLNDEFMKLYYADSPRQPARRR